MCGHDIGQVLDWLQAVSHTQRAFRKQAERFLLLDIMHKARAPSSMSNAGPIAHRLPGRPAAAQPVVRRPQADRCGGRSTARCRLRRGGMRSRS